jgi:small glutamine-rich tetratricopeptide repeat-containing protein alpha
MQQKDYKTAIEKYTAAVTLSPTNPIYLSNRAAAYSASGDHAAAVKDAEVAVVADPKYTKAWSRLGLARFAMGDARGSVDAYQKGIEHEGSGGSEAMKKGLETAKKELARMESEEDNVPAEGVDDAPGDSRGAPGLPDMAGLASMLGGGAGGGGMPDLSSIMSKYVFFRSWSSPIQVVSNRCTSPMFAGMARNLMQNPEALSSIMQNPVESYPALPKLLGQANHHRQMVQNMMNQRREGGGGGMPDMSSIQQMMQDPAIAGLASQFMGGGGAGGAPGAGAGRGAGR